MSPLQDGHFSGNRALNKHVLERLAEGSYPRIGESLVDFGLILVLEQVEEKRIQKYVIIIITGKKWVDSNTNDESRFSNLLYEESLCLYPPFRYFS